MRELAPMRKSLKRTLGLGIVGGVAFAAWRAWNAQAAQRPRGPEWTTAPFPFPPAPRPAADRPAPAAEPASATTPVPAPAAAATPAWTEPNADGSCPEGHPIKAKLASGIYHVPGGANYARTHADRCYVDEAAAKADGLRPSKV